MKKAFAFLIIGFISLALTTTASAVPNYAKQTGEACSYCHSTQWPSLNDYGKRFLENGLRSLPSKEIADDTFLSDGTIGARLNFRLLDKRTSKNKKGDLGPGDKQLKYRGGHELEVFVTGRAGKAFYFVELESEDEWGEENAPGFNVQTVAMYGGYYVSPQMIFRFGLMSPFDADGNNTVHRHKQVRYSGKMGSFTPGESQGMSVNGRMGNVSYIVALHGNPDDLEGHDPKGKAIRVAYDLMNGLTVGGFVDMDGIYDSDAKVSSGSNDLRGIDMNLQMGALSLQALYAQREENSSVDSTFSVAADMEIADFVVSALSDVYTAKDGKDKWHKGGLFMTYFLMENMKIQAGVEGALSAPSAYEHKERRYTFVLDLGI